MLRREARTIVSAVGMTRDVMSIIEVAFVRAWEHNALPLAGNFTFSLFCVSVWRGFGGEECHSFVCLERCMCHMSEVFLHAFP